MPIPGSLSGSTLPVFRSAIGADAGIDAGPGPGLSVGVVCEIRCADGWLDA